jgi:hypothetical protein
MTWRRGFLVRFRWQQDGGIIYSIGGLFPSDLFLAVVAVVVVARACW